MSALADAEPERKEAADKLATADAALRAAVQALRAAQDEVSSARESKARTEARLEGARNRRQEEARRIRETLDVAPEQCLSLAGIGPGEALPALVEADRRCSASRATASGSAA